MPVCCTRLAFLFIGLFGAAFHLPLAGQLDDLMLVEYVDWNSGSGVAVRLYNPTAQSVNLSNYSLTVHNNGSLSPSATTNLSGNLPAQGHLVYGNSSYPCTPDQNFNTVGVNGNDAIVLRRNGAIVDMIGLLGGNTTTNSGLLYHQRVVRSDSNCLRYTDTSGFAPLSWPNAAVSTFSGWQAQPVSCLGASNPYSPLASQRSASPDLQICNGSSALIYGQSRSQPGVYYDTTLTAAGCWQIDSTRLTVVSQQEIVIDTSICAGAALAFGGISLTQPGTYRDTLTGSGGCDSIVSLNLRVRPADSIREVFAICPGDSLLWQGQYYRQAGSYQQLFQNQTGCDSARWLQLNALEAPLTQERYLLCQGGEVVINGRAYRQDTVFERYSPAPSGCDSVIQVVIRRDSVQAAFSWQWLGADSNRLAMENRSLNAREYRWFFGNGTSSRLGEPVAEYQDSGSYRILLVAISAEGCRDSLIQVVQIPDLRPRTVWVPNSFTPNNDGRNDQFQIVTARPELDLRISIFNRWGQRVFYAEGADFRWDGTFRGQDCPPGVYVYHLEGAIGQRGTIRLLR